MAAQRVPDRLGRLRLGPLAEASDGEEDNHRLRLQHEKLARDCLRRGEAQMQGERAELDHDEAHVPRQVRKQARQHVLRRGPVLRGIDKRRMAARPRCLEQLDQTDGEPLVRLRLLRPLQLDRHGAVEEHAPVAWLVEAPAILRDRRSDHADGERIARLERGVQPPEVAVVAEMHERAPERRLVERVVVAEQAAHRGGNLKFAPTW